MDFILDFDYHDSLIILMKGHLATLVPILLDSMKYRKNDEITQSLHMTNDEDCCDTDIDEEAHEQLKLRISATTLLGEISVTFKGEVIPFILLEIERRLSIER